MRLQVLDRDIRHKMNAHVARWKDCHRCTIGKLAYKHVFARGSLPCDLLFIGEAPGKSEDTIGVPFIGRSGKLLDQWITSAQMTLAAAEYDRNKKPGIPGSTAQLPSYAITNMVACRPTDCEGGPNRQPLPREMKRCEPRLQEFIELAAPKCIVLLGRVASDNTAGSFHLPTLQLPHPAYALRTGGETGSVSREAIEKLTAFIEKHYGTD